MRDVAKAVHYSPTYLTDLIRRETGWAIHQWIGERRMHASRLLLSETDRPIAEVAEEAGFRDAAYFGRYFAKVMGQTPRTWREMQRRGPKRESADIIGHGFSIHSDMTYGDYILNDDTNRPL